MKLNKYIIDKWFPILISLISILIISVILIEFNVNLHAIIIADTISALNLIIILIYNYIRKVKFYNNLEANLKLLDKKYLIIETLPEPITYEEKIMINSLYEINKSMIENIKKIEANIIDFKEFVELWIHEVKIPISSLVLKCHNNREKFGNELYSIIRKLDDYIDQILYYVRSEETEKDFVITEVNLRDIVKNVALKNKDDLLENNIELKVDVKDFQVNTDSKWMEYIINQIINNSIKYKKSKDSKIEIKGLEEKDKVILSIYDNGIGISKKDIKKVFEKSFTGENGRSKAKSTGMGLYIVKKLCTKLGHLINIESVEKEYTIVKITFNKHDFYKM